MAACEICQAEGLEAAEHSRAAPQGFLPPLIPGKRLGIRVLARHCPMAGNLPVLPSLWLFLEGALGWGQVAALGHLPLQEGPAGHGTGLGQGGHRETPGCSSLPQEGVGMVLGACTLRHNQTTALKAPSCLLISFVPQDVESFN